MGSFEEYKWLTTSAKIWWRRDYGDGDPAENAKRMLEIIGQAGVIGGADQKAANDLRNDLFNMVLIFRSGLHFELCQKPRKIRYSPPSNLQNYRPRYNLARQR